MKKHEISLPKLQEWMRSNEVLYAADTLSDKRLTVTMSGGFKLYHNNEIVWQGIQPYFAVEKYNSL